jgi:branched-chain amino acid transport system substrate-binding protein
MNNETSRRQFLTWAGRAGFGGAALAVLASCGKSGGSNGASNNVSSGSQSSSGNGFKASGDTLKIGIVAPFSGVAAFVGRIVSNSLDAATAQVNATGGIGGRKVEVVKRDTGTDASAGVKAYQAMASDKNIIGILWAGSGLDESRAQIARDNMPVISVFVDLWSAHQLYPATKERSIFQMIMPDRMALDLLGQYAKEDRGYSKAGLIYDSLISPSAKDYFTEAMAKHGLATAGIETYQLNDADFGPQVRRLQSQKGQTLMIWGLAGDTAGIVKQIDKVGASYVDTPTAKGASWRPQILGSPGGTGEHTWADLAGSSAKAGTLTAWHVGGLNYLPSFAISGWMKKYLKKSPTGGEESPADGMYTLLKAVEVAGSTDRQKMISAIETMGEVKFASTPFSYAADRHLSKQMDDLILITLERSSGPVATSPAYQLGQEWKDTYTAGYAGPTHLVRPTLEANKRAHPDVMDEVLRLGYGTQCTKHADGTMTNDCKIH